MFPHHHGRRLLQQGAVQGMVDVQGGIPQEGVPMGALPKGVAVMFAHHLEAGVEIRRRLLAEGHPDVRGQAAVEGVGELGAGDAALRIEMGHLGPGVDAAVRAAGGMESEIFARDFFECIADDLLNGNSVGLNLPAMISCAVVGQIDKISLHVSFYS